MSKLPFTESDIELFGKAGTMIDELTGEVIEITDAMSKAKSQFTPVKKAIDELVASLKDASAPAKEMKDLSREVGSGKTKKGVKSMHGMLKTLVANPIQAWAMEQLITLLKPFLNILNLFTPIIKVLAAIFQQALMPLMQALMPIIMFFVDLLMQFSPIIEQLIGVALQPLIMFLEMFMSMLTDNQALFDELFSALEMIMGVVAEVMEEIMSSKEIMIAMKVAIMGLMYVIKAIIFVIKILAVVIKAVVAVVKFLIDAIQKLIGWIKGIFDWFNKILGLGGGGNVRGAQAGGIAMREQTVRVAEDKPELIAPLDPFNERLDNLAYQNSRVIELLEWIKEDKMWRHRRE